VSELSWNTRPDEYCDMLLILSTCNSRAGSAAGEYAIRYLGRHRDANVFRLSEQGLRETGNVKPMTHLNACRLRTMTTPTNKFVIIAALEREPWRIKRDIVIRRFGGTYRLRHQGRRVSEAGKQN
jgi:hypothetical protein